MLTIRSTLLFFILLLFAIQANAQEIEFGDVSVVKGIKKKTSAIYDNSDKTDFYLTSQKLLPFLTRGVNLVAHQANGQINRVITTAMTEDGQVSMEWYFDQDELIFVYEVLEFFDESPRKGSWRNFKGLFGQEGRYYFHGRKLSYHKHVGRTDISSTLNGTNILRTAKKILAYLNRQ